MQAPKCLYIRIILSTLYSYSNQPSDYLYTQIGLQFRQDQLCNQKHWLIQYLSKRLLNILSQRLLHLK